MKPMFVSLRVNSSSSDVVHPSFYVCCIQLCLFDLCLDALCGTQVQGNSFQKKVALLFGASHAVEVNSFFNSHEVKIFTI